MKFSPQQQTAIDLIHGFMKSDEKRFVLGGAAGTGKTTLSREITKEYDNVVHCALTGKAANVLREMGNKNAMTIHAATYTKISGDDEELVFGLNEGGDLKDSKLLIVDESFMLNEEIITDIESVADKVLYMGDPFQLPPVSGECILKPDYFLDEVHRQALESPILRAATDIREGRALVECEYPGFKYGPKHWFTSEDYEHADQIIVGRNDTRTAWNLRFREKMGFAGQKFPCRGDKLICTRNNHRKALFNGMIGEADSDARKVSFEELSLDFDGHKGLAVWDGNFVGRPDQPKGINKTFDRFDYAYAITCHKSQGSEFDDVLIYNQPIGKDKLERRRWLYTAITRGKKSVKVVKP